MSKPQRQEEDLTLRLTAEALLKGRMASTKDESLRCKPYNTN